MSQYIGYCNTDGCKDKGKQVKFEVPYDKIDAYRNEPPTCTVCGQALQGDVYNTKLLI